MNGSAALERRYRRLLVLFPADHRREYGEEMIGVLLACTPQGRRRPRLADAFDLIVGGLRARLRPRGTRLSGAHWTDALAVCSIALPVLVLTALAVNYAWKAAIGYRLPSLSGFYLPSLALALPPLIALWYRRTAAVVALVAASWFWFLLLGSLTVWIDGLEASYCVALAVQVIALAGSPGPRRAAAVMTWKTWLVLSVAISSKLVLRATSGSDPRSHEIHNQAIVATGVPGFPERVRPRQGNLSGSGMKMVARIHNPPGEGRWAS